MSGYIRHPMAPTAPSVDVMVGDLIMRDTSASTLITGGNHRDTAFGHRDRPYTNINSHCLIRIQDRPTEVISVPMLSWTDSRYNPPTPVLVSRLLQNVRQDIPVELERQLEDMSRRADLGAGEIQHGITIINYNSRPVLLKIFLILGVPVPGSITPILLHEGSATAFRELSQAEQQQFISDQRDLESEFRASIMPLNIRLGMDTGKLEFLNSSAQWIQVTSQEVLEEPRLNRPGRFRLSEFADPFSHYLLYSDYFRELGHIEIYRRDNEARDSLVLLYRSIPGLKELLGPLAPPASPRSSAESGSDVTGEKRAADDDNNSTGS